MSKPTDLPTWATNATFLAGPKVGEATTVEPTSGKQADGWYPGEKPPAPSLNWWMHLVYLWVAWLNGLWDTDGSLTMDEDANIILSGTGFLAHGEVPLVIPASAAASQMGVGDSGAQCNGYNWNFQQFGTTTATALYVVYPIVLPVGARIKSWSLTLNKQTNNTHDITAELLRALLSGGTAEVIGTSQVHSGNSPGNTTIGQTGIIAANALIDVNWQYTVRVKSPDSQASNGVDQSAALVITYDRPAS